MAAVAMAAVALAMSAVSAVSASTPSQVRFRVGREKKTQKPRVAHQGGGSPGEKLRLAKEKPLPTQQRRPPPRQQREAIDDDALVHRRFSSRTSKHHPRAAKQPTLPSQAHPPRRLEAAVRWKARRPAATNQASPPYPRPSKRVALKRESPRFQLRPLPLQPLPQKGWRHECRPALTPGPPMSPQPAPPPSPT